MVSARLVLNRILVLPALILAAASALPANISINFDDSPLASDNNDPLLQFYNGGTTYLGKGPGPSLGVTFSLNAVEITNTNNLIGTFTQPGIAELNSMTAIQGEPLSFTMDVNGGFAGTMAFDYAAVQSAGTLYVYSGADGGGSVLDQIALTATSQSQGIFVADSVTFSGIAHSAVFTGGNQQLGIDDVVLQTTPEPSYRALTGIAFLCGTGIWLLRRSRAARASTH